MVPQCASAAEPLGLLFGGAEVESQLGLLERGRVGQRRMLGRSSAATGTTLRLWICWGVSSLSASSRAAHGSWRSALL